MYSIKFKYVFKYILVTIVSLGFSHNICAGQRQAHRAKKSMRMNDYKGAGNRANAHGKAPVNVAIRSSYLDREALIKEMLELIKKNPVERIEGLDQVSADLLKKAYADYQNKINNNKNEADALREYVSVIDIILKRQQKMHAQENVFMAYAFAPFRNVYEGFYARPNIKQAVKGVAGLGVYAAGIFGVGSVLWEYVLGERERVAQQAASRAEQERVAVLEAERLAQVERERVAEAARLEQERLARAEQERLAAQREAERLARLEQERLAAQREAARTEQERVAAQREAERLAAQREAARAEQERVAAQREAARLEQERLARAEQERVAAQREAARLAAQREAERLAAQREAARAEQERVARAEQERVAAQREAARAEQERLARAEQERVAAQREAERLARLEQERLAAQREAARTEQERVAAQREAERLARLEQERLAAQREAARTEQERVAAQREVERLARLEQERQQGVQDVALTGQDAPLAAAQAAISAARAAQLDLPDDDAERQLGGRAENTGGAVPVLERGPNLGRPAHIEEVDCASWNDVDQYMKSFVLRASTNFTVGDAGVQSISTNGINWAKKTLIVIDMDDTVGVHIPDPAGSGRRLFIPIPGVRARSASVIIKKWQDRRAIALGLTARKYLQSKDLLLPGVLGEWQIGNVPSELWMVGIDYCTPVAGLNLSGLGYSEEQREAGSGYRDGVIYSAGMSKGEALRIFLNSNPTLDIKNIVFVDDSHNRIQEVRAFLEEEQRYDGILLTFKGAGYLSKLNNVWREKKRAEREGGNVNDAQQKVIQAQFEAVVPEVVLGVVNAFDQLIDVTAQAYQELREGRTQLAVPREMNDGALGLTIRESNLFALPSTGDGAGRAPREPIAPAPQVQVLMESKDVQSLTDLVGPMIRFILPGKTLILVDVNLTVGVKAYFGKNQNGENIELLIPIEDAPASIRDWQEQGAIVLGITAQTYTGTQEKAVAGDPTEGDDTLLALRLIGIDYDTPQVQALALQNFGNFFAQDGIEGASYHRGVIYAGVGNSLRIGTALGKFLVANVEALHFIERIIFIDDDQNSIDSARRFFGENLRYSGCLFQFSGGLQKLRKFANTTDVIGENYPFICTNIQDVEALDQQIGAIRVKYERYLANPASLLVQNGESDADDVPGRAPNDNAVARVVDQPTGPALAAPIMSNDLVTIHRDVERWADVNKVIMPAIISGRTLILVDVDLTVGVKVFFEINGNDKEFLIPIDGAPGVIRGWQEQGAIVLGLTARTYNGDPGKIERGDSTEGDDTLLALQLIGIDYYTPQVDALRLQDFNAESMSGIRCLQNASYHRGVIYVGGHNSDGKGAALEKFLEVNGQQLSNIQRIMFIDDSHGCIQSVSSFLNKTRQYQSFLFRFKGGEDMLGRSVQESFFAQGCIKRHTCSPEYAKALDEHIAGIRGKYVLYLLKPDSLLVHGAMPGRAPAAAEQPQ